MSATTGALRLRGFGRQGGRSRGRALPAAERPLVRLAAFAALAAYGTLQWGTLIAGAPTWRLLGMLAVSIALAAAGPPLAAAGPLLAQRRRLLAPLVGVVALLAILALSGVPVRWITHVRVAVTGEAIGQGLSALPRILLPYNGINDWVRAVMLLGAGVLLLDAGLLLAFAPTALGELRRAAAALPLVALAIVPSTLVRPQLPYLDGLVLFILLAAFMWGERIRRDDLAATLAICAVAGAAAMLAAPRLDSHRPWIDYQALAAGLGPGHVDAFDWSQRYGPLNWPRTGHEVLDVRAQRPDYWKAEDLDLFDGRGWAPANFSPPNLAADVDRSASARWTQTLQVTMRGMTTTEVIAAGSAQPPTHLSGFVEGGASPGTWTDTTALGPGDSYWVTVYTPQPTGAQLARAGKRYPAASLRPYLSLAMPVPLGVSQDVVFAPFGSQGAPVNLSDLVDYTGKSAVAQSPYAGAFALAARLRRGAATPYAYVMKVQGYLQHGYTYNETPPRRSYPLVSFLFKDKIGYCQQFAGAMALLLRMGGIPARVAAGFTPGTLDAASGRWAVSDVDAHAWVEAWFPHYGWVRFDPTPPAAPARGGHAPILYAPNPVGTSAPPRPLIKRRDIAAGPLASASRVRHGGSSDVVVIAGAGALLALIALVLLLTRGPAESSAEQMVGELERALARSGRPISAGVTLSALEKRFGVSSEAAGYIRALRLARFAGNGELPGPLQRRAVRAQLRAGLGLAGALRALWALPPRWRAPRRRRESESGALNSS